MCLGHKNRQARHITHLLGGHSGKQLKQKVKQSALHEAVVIQCERVQAGEQELEQGLAVAEPGPSDAKHVEFEVLAAHIGTVQQRQRLRRNIVTLSQQVKR